MSTPEDVALARRLAEFERRLQGLERGTRLNRAAIVVDDTGRSVGVTGAVVAGSREAALQAARALAPITPPQPGVARSVYFTAEEPVEAITDDLWLRSDDDVLTVQTVEGWWVQLSDQSAAAAIAGLRSALTTDDGRIVVWADPNLPTGGPAPAFGDLWLQANTVAYRWEGTAGWQPLVVAEGQSLNYVAGENGWTITPDGDAQLQDVTMLGSASVPSLAAGTITLGDQDLATTLASSSIGKILSARLPFQSGPIACTTTNTKIFELNCGTVNPGRTYRVSTSMLLDGTAPLALTDRIAFTYRYTVDGTSPTTSSPLMDSGFNDSYYQMGDFTAVRPEAEIDIVSAAQLKIGLFVRVWAGAGSYAIYAGPTSANSCPTMTLYDDGPSGARQDSAISLTGGGVARFVKTYNASWAFGIDSSYGNTLLDSFFHVGGEDDSCGFVGFNSASMVAQLAAATTPISCVVRWRPKYRRTSAGLDVKLATHNHTSSAAASAASGGLPLFAYSNAAGYGLTLLANVRNNAVPGSPYEESLGVSVFNQFKAGTRKGLAFLGTPEASITGGEGLVYGDGAYEMQLVFTYDGTS